MKTGDKVRLKAPVIEGEIIDENDDYVLVEYEADGDTHQRWFDRKLMEVTKAAKRG